MFTLGLPCFIVLLMLFKPTFQTSVSESWEDDFQNMPEHIKDTSSSAKNILNVTPLQYEVHLEPNYTWGSEPWGFSIDFVTVWTTVLVRVEGQRKYGYGETIQFKTIPNEFQLMLLKVNGRELNTTRLIQVDVMTHQITLATPPEKGDVLEIFLLYKLVTRHTKCGMDWNFDEKGLLLNASNSSKNSLKGITIVDARAYCASTGGKGSDYKQSGTFSMLPNFQNDHQNRVVVKVSVMRPFDPDIVVLSNMDVEETTEFPARNNWVIDHFALTPPIQTDQFTVIILRGMHNRTIYDSVASASNLSKNLSISVWATDCGIKNENQTNLLNQTLYELVRIHRYFWTYFNSTKYPVKKLDYVVFPRDTNGCSTLGLLAALDGVSGEHDLYKQSTLKLCLVRQVASQWMDRETMLAEQGLGTSEFNSTKQMDVSVQAYYNVYNDSRFLNSFIST